MTIPIGSTFFHDNIFTRQIQLLGLYYIIANTKSIVGRNEKQITKLKKGYR